MLLTKVEDVRALIQEELPDYTIVKSLGSGSSAQVYLAKQNSLNRTVAIKRFSLQQHNNRNDLVLRFIREATLWAHLSHENLIHLYDYRKSHQSQYLMLEYCHGIDLRKVIDAVHVFPIDVAVSIVMQAAKALTYLHEYNIVHRDLKPANIYLRCDGTVKIMDFGISTSSELEAMTAPGSIMGTPAYMSPEQAQAVADIDGRSDIFSLGIIWYELLEGQKPFTSKTINSLLSEIITGKYKRVSKKFPKNIQKIVAQSIHHKRESRIQLAHTMVQWCQNYLYKKKVPSAKKCVQEFLLQHHLVNEVKRLFHNEDALSLTSSSKSLHMYRTKVLTEKHSFKENSNAWLIVLAILLPILALIAYAIIKNPDILQNIKPLMYQLRQLIFEATGF